MAARDILRIRADEIVDGELYKVCSRCGRLLPLDDFGLTTKKGAATNGATVIVVQSWCRECRRPK